MEYGTEQLAKIAAEVLRSNRIVAIGTADTSGVPWVAPMMFAYDSADSFIWVSALDCQHSNNLAVNPNVALTVFDSNPEYGKAQALYCLGTARRLTAKDEIEAACAVFYERRYPDPAERAEKGRHAGDFLDPSPRGIYCAEVLEYSILHPNKHPQFGSLVDYRVRIPFSTSTATV